MSGGLYIPAMAESIEINARGTLLPKRLPPRFQRIVPTGKVCELVSWWWLTDWNQPEGEPSRQHLLAFPASNLVVERDNVSFAGPTTRASHVDLLGSGWVVAALLQPACVPAFTDAPSSYRDRWTPIAAPSVHDNIREAMNTSDADAAVSRLADWLVERVGDPSEEARLANTMAHVAGTDPRVVTVGDLADALHVSSRTLHRLASRYVGLTPYAIIRRRRLQEAAERVRLDPRVMLRDVAAECGFADQAHLAREFKRVLGRTPAHYRAELSDRT